MVNECLSKSKTGDTKVIEIEIKTIRDLLIPIVHDWCKKEYNVSKHIGYDIVVCFKKLKIRTKANKLTRFQIDTPFFVNPNISSDTLFYDIISPILRKNRLNDWNRYTYNEIFP